MGDEQHLPALLVPQTQQQGLHLLASKGVEGAEGLVEQQQLRLGGQRPGDADPLALTAGELPDRLGVGLLQPHLAQHGQRAGLAFAARHAGKLQAEGNVVQYVAPGQQAIVLKHHPSLGAGAAHRPPLQSDGALLGALKTGDEVEQGGLAAAGGAEHHHQLARIQGQVDVVEDSAPGVIGTKVSELQHACLLVMRGQRA